MNTHPMKQNEATKDRPFYSVAYQYKNQPYKLNSHNHYGGLFGEGLHGRTQYGTSDLDVAKAQADWLITRPGIVYAQVSKTEDCYNHQTVYETNRDNNNQD